MLYKFKCTDCNVGCYGETTRHYLLRCCEYSPISPFSYKHSKTLPTLISQHLTEKCCHHNTLKKFKLLTSEKTSEYWLKIQDSLFKACENACVCVKKIRIYKILLKGHGHQNLPLTTPPPPPSFYSRIVIYFKNLNEKKTES